MRAYAGRTRTPSVTAQAATLPGHTTGGLPPGRFGGSPSGSRQGRTGRRKGRVNGGGERLPERFARTVRSIRTSSQELTMADLAFVVTTLAVFALVALVARGVTKL
jgi:hypothetical protein